MLARRLATVFVTMGMATSTMLTPAFADESDTIAPIQPYLAMADTGETTNGVPVLAAADGGDNGPRVDGTTDIVTAGQYWCFFYTNGDYVHISSTAFEASAHGWWTNGNCRATYAKVTVQLEEKKNGTWYRVGVVGSSTVRSGGGSANRSTGRAACTGSGAHQWRSVVDVDLVGQADTDEKGVSPERTLNCSR
jgi:hypothetical protein